METKTKEQGSRWRFKGYRDAEGMQGAPLKPGDVVTIDQHRSDRGGYYVSASGNPPRRDVLFDEELQDLDATKWLTMEEIINKHNPSAIVLRKWLQRRGVFLPACNTDQEVIDYAVQHIPDASTEDHIVAMMNEPNMDVGVWFQSQTSGLWYGSYEAAGSVRAVSVDGIKFVNVRPDSRFVGALWRALRENQKESDEEGKVAIARVLREEFPVLLDKFLQLAKGEYLLRKKFDGADDDAWDITDHTTPSADDPLTVHSMELEEGIDEIIRQQSES